MQYMEFIALLTNKRFFWSSPRRTAVRPITAQLLRWQLVDITPG